MNAKARKELNQIAAVLTDISDKLELLRDSEQEKYDNLSEGLQQSEKGQSLEDAVTALDSAIDNLQMTVSDVEEATSC